MVRKDLPNFFKSSQAKNCQKKVQNICIKPILKPENTQTMFKNAYSGENILCKK
jgi:hypothetical protein